MGTGGVAARIKVSRTIDSDVAAIAFFGPGLAGMRRESLRVAHLDRDRRLIGLRLDYSDRCDSIDFPLRQIIHDAIHLKTDGLIIAHNHPSGDPSPSRADLLATRSLVDLLRPLGVRLHDHLIFADGESRSLRAMGFI